MNVRDLGGFTTPAGATTFGVFVRADNARKLSAAGWRAAREYGIRTVLDLRSEPECAADPPAHPRFAHRRLSLFDHFDGDAAYRADLMARVGELDSAGKYATLYREALELDAARFAEAFAVLADGEDGVLFHCAGGKDRTGLLAALLLRLVGVPIEEVEEDYVRSELRLRHAADAPRHDGGTPRGAIGRVIADVEARYGGATAYLVRAGASPQALDWIRRRFVRREG